MFMGSDDALVLLWQHIFLLKFKKLSNLCCGQYERVGLGQFVKTDLLLI